MDVGCYCVNAARLLAGEPERVTAQQALGGDGVDVVFTGTMSFADEITALFRLRGSCSRPETSSRWSVKPDLCISMTPGTAARPVIEVRTDAGVDRIRLPLVDSYMLEAENLSAAIAGEAEPLLGRADAIGQASTIEALYASADAGGTPVNRDG